MNKLDQKNFEFFTQTYKQVPAYKSFVNSHGIDLRKIKSAADFNNIPPCDRHNYLNKYPLEDRISQKHHLSDYYLVTTSSGSTGKPTLWIRNQQTDEFIAGPKEEFYKEFFQTHQKKTLIVVTYVLGMWIGGILETLLAIKAAKKHPITIVTPGMNLENSLTAITELYQHYDQVIILGYPPFVTDLINEVKQRLPIDKMNLKINLTGDSFSELWRRKVKKIINSKSNHDIVGMYACSDTGVIGEETKFTIDILDKIQDHPKEIKRLFNSIHTPSLVAYNPQTKFIEVINHEIVITANQPVPLVRYNIHDRGKLIKAADLVRLAKKLGINFSKLDENKHYLAIYGRTDSVLVSAANVYIDDIKYCIQNSKYANKFSENFKFGNVDTSGLKKRLKVEVYLKPNQELTKKQKQEFENQFYQDLISVNADFEVVQQGTKTQNFLFVYKQESPGEDKFKNNKLKYLLK